MRSITTKDTKRDQKSLCTSAGLFSCLSSFSWLMAFILSFLFVASVSAEELKDVVERNVAIGKVDDVGFRVLKFIAEGQ